MSTQSETIGAAWDISLNVRTDLRVHGIATPCAGTEKKFSFVKSRLTPRDLQIIEKTFEDCRKSLEAVVLEDYSSSMDPESPE